MLGLIGKEEKKEKKERDADLVFSWENAMDRRDDFDDNDEETIDTFARNSKKSNYLSLSHFLALLLIIFFLFSIAMREKMREKMKDKKKRAEDLTEEDKKEEVTYNLNSFDLLLKDNSLHFVLVIRPT